MGAISTHGEAKRSLEFMGGDKDRQLKHLWEGTRIGDILPWDEIEDEAEKCCFLREYEPIGKLQMTAMSVRSRKMTQW
jgi:hypothetical protein